MSVWNWKKNEWIIIVFCSLLTAAVALSFISIGVRTGFEHYKEDVGFNGVSYPEVGLLNLLLHASALLGLACVVIRYEFIANMKHSQNSYVILPDSAHKINTISLKPGLASFAGLILLAAFPGNTNTSGVPVRTVGAYIFSSCGFLYLILQTTISFYYCKSFSRFKDRIAGCIAFTIYFTMSLVFSLLRTKDSRWDADYPSALILDSAIVLNYSLFFVTFYKEFRLISTAITFEPVTVNSSSDPGSTTIVNEIV